MKSTFIISISSFATKPSVTLCVFLHVIKRNLLECSTKIKKLGSLNNYQPIR